MNKVADSTLDKYFRQAVYKRWDYKCAYCESPVYEAHHIVRCGKRVLRWDYRNGICLCPKHHTWAATLAGRRWVEGKVDLDYLTERDVTLVDYCLSRGITRDEFRIEKLNELKEYLNGE